MNKKQAEMVVELIQEGFVDEAMVLARTYTSDTSILEEDNEKIASSNAVKQVKALLKKFLPIRILESIIKRISTTLFPRESLDLKKVMQKTIMVVSSILSILAPYILMQLFLAGMQAGSGKERKQVNKEKQDRYNREAKVYQSMVSDNLRHLKKKINKMAQESEQKVPQNRGFDLDERGRIQPSSIDNQGKPVWDF